MVRHETKHPLIELLGLAESSKAELELFHHSVSVVETRLEEQVEELKTDIFLGHADFQQIWRYLPVISKEQYLSRIESGKIKLCEEEKKDPVLSQHFLQQVKGKLENAEETKHGILSLFFF